MEITIRLRSVVWFVTAMLAGALVMLVVMWAASADAAPGDTDTTFVPITPCRLVDTRPDPAFRVGTLPTFGPEQTRIVDAHGTNGDCTIPTEAVGLSLNVTAPVATSNTFVTVWPGGTRPDASSLNPQPGIKSFNAVTVPLDGGSFQVFNKAGNTDLIIDVNGYYTQSSLRDLADDLAELTGEVAELRALTASMTLETVDGAPVVRFSGVNVQVVSGGGATDAPVNGTGNLIVGYAEDTSDVRTGSHNLVVGDGHTYSSFGGIVAGENNRITAGSASVTGGTFNTASGLRSSVSGGSNNAASGSQASVTGGVANTAVGATSSVNGGADNVASGNTATVSGGLSGSASGDYDWVAGSLLEDS